MGTARRLSLAAVAAGLVLLTAAGCGTGSGGQQTVATPRQWPHPTPTLNPDGSVPWADEPATDADFTRPVAPPPPAEGPTCAGSQLAASLAPWIHKSTGEETNDPILEGSLYGFVNLTNSGTKACTLQGIPAVTLLAAGQPVPISYDKIGAQNATKTGLPPGASASFRLDWDAPFCLPGTAPDHLRAALPGGSDVLMVTLTDRTTPRCVHQETHPELNQSTLTTSPIHPGAVEPATVEPASPMTKLTAKLRGTPATVSAGQALAFQVVLTNPTAAGISIAGHPGYVLEIFCMGTEGRTGLNVSLLYLLNNSVVTSIAPGESRAFDLRYRLAAGVPLPGPILSVSWRMIDVTMVGDAPYNVVSIPAQN